MRRPAIGTCIAVGLVTATVAIGVDDGPSAPIIADAAGVTTRYEPLQPCRLADSRESAEADGLVTIDDHTRRMSIDACGVPPEATAIVVTATIINDSGRGFLTLFPAGGERPGTANLNWDAGITRGNSATVTVGVDGIDVFKSNGFRTGNVAIDVVGAFVPAAQSTIGRFVTPERAIRLVDTRNGERPGDGAVVRVPIPDGVAADASALAINVTAVQASGRGFFTAYPAGSPRPDASMLNVDRPGQFRSAATIVAVSADGFDVYVESSADVVIDMTGWFTGASASSSNDGLFVPIEPRRIRDTRAEPAPIHPDGTIDVVLPGQLTTGTQPGAPAAVAVSVTMIDARGQGFITAHPARAPRGGTASGYSLRRELTAQFAVSAVSASGLGVYSSAGTELTVDLLGWFTGSTTATSGPPAANVATPAHVLAIGDSSMAGVDRTGANGALRGAEFTFLASSCRRLVRPSCVGLDGPIPPPTALDVINGVPVDRFDVLIMMTGYNDQMPAFAGDVAAIIDAARRVGIDDVIWMTMAREFRTDRGGANAFQVYQEHNSVIRVNGFADDVHAIEWSTLVRQSPSWVYPDGIHLDRPGGFGAADVMSRAVAHVTGQRCPIAEVPGAQPVGVCPDPGTRPPVDVRALYGF